MGRHGGRAGPHPSAVVSRIAPNHAEGAYDWTALDHAVDRVVAAGMEPMLNDHRPGPAVGEPALGARRAAI